ncbi:thioredoxin [Candidatus Bathyarchaeota archaeon]|nr:MAG: thioredoxin [Candidatus Bathyarchaeota archaeon]
MRGEPEKPSIWRDGEVIELNEANFDDAISTASKPVLVDFWAVWCPPCRVMSPIVEELARDYAGRAYFAKVNVDENQGLALRFRVMSIPSFLLFKGGRLVDRVVGAVGRGGLEAMLRKVL